jgi:hypothetical protein
MPWRAEEHRVSRRPAGEGMGGSVSLTKVGFHFDNAANPYVLTVGPNQQFSQQLPGHEVGGIQIEISGNDPAADQSSSHGLL